MASGRRAVTADTLGAWLLKANPRLSPVGELLRTGFRTVTHRCVGAGYRTGLMQPGQLVLFWVSGGDADTPAGLHGQGVTTGIPAAAEGAAPGSSLDLPVALAPLDPPVLRSELLAHPTLCRMEVLRMAAGSNPSFLTRVELDALRSQWPQVVVG